MKKKHRKKQLSKTRKQKKWIQELSSGSDLLNDKTKNQIKFSTHFIN